MLKSALYRVVTVLGRLVVMLAITRELGTEALGSYGIVTATTYFLMFVAGFEFRVHSNRCISVDASGAVGAMIRTQLLVTACGLVLLAPLAATLHDKSLSDVMSLTVLLGIICFEAASFELCRILTAMARNTAANLVQAAKQGLHATLVIYAISATEVNFDFQWVWNSWLFAAATSTALAAGFVGRGFLAPDWLMSPDWIRDGLKAARFAFFNALATRILFFLDRYALLWLTNRQTLGAYTFCIGVTTAMQGIADAAFVSQRQANIIRGWQDGSSADLLKTTAWWVCATSLAFAVTLPLGGPVVSMIVGAEGAVIWDLPLLLVLTLVAMLNLLGRLYGFPLVALRQYRHLATTAVIPALLVIATAIPATISFGAVGLAGSLAAGFAVTTALRYRISKHP